MAIRQSQVQIKYIPPKGEYETFRDEEQYKDKLKEWGLSSAKEAKREFWYKERNYQSLVTIKGFEQYGNLAELNTIIIEFPDGNVSCIHPAFLKEMQQSSFGKERLFPFEEKDTESLPEELELTNIESTENMVTFDPTITGQGIERAVSDTKFPDKSVAHNPLKADETPKTSKEQKPKSKKEKGAKLELPEEKVHFIASVKQFALTYNPFNEENEEVVVLENVQIVGGHPHELGHAWCSHSKTLKKFELAPGDTLEFAGKVVAKKLAKGKDAPEEFEAEVPVLYKINNPSKIKKR